MLDSNFLTLLILIIAAAPAIYKISYLSKKTIGYFSLLQYIYLVIIPGLVFSIAYSYHQAILARPKASVIVIPDGYISHVLFLAMFYSYGGVAIHAVTKMLSELLRNDNSKAKDINKYFHLRFSHNLVYSGGVFMILCFALLELNHPDPANTYSLLAAVIKGLIMGGSLLAAMLWYTSSRDEYIGRWSDLKSVFLVSWLGILVLLFLIKKMDPSIKNYQLLLPALMSFFVVAILNMVLIFQKIKKGGFIVFLKIGKRRQKLIEVKDVFSNKKQSSTKSN
jgi:hypothetical protein